MLNAKDAIEEALESYCLIGVVQISLFQKWMSARSWKSGRTIWAKHKHPEYFSLLRRYSIFRDDDPHSFMHSPHCKGMLFVGRNRLPVPPDLDGHHTATPFTLWLLHKQTVEDEHVRLLFSLHKRQNYSTADGLSGVFSHTKSCDF